MRLPTIATTIQDLSLLQTKWKSVLDVLLSRPSLDCSILSNITLVTGSNTINHELGRVLQGWRIVRLRSPAAINDTQDSNPQPRLTLMLTSSANVVADIEVF